MRILIFAIILTMGSTGTCYALEVADEALECQQNDPRRECYKSDEAYINSYSPPIIRPLSKSKLTDREQQQQELNRRRNDKNPHNDCDFKGAEKEKKEIDLKCYFLANPEGHKIPEHEKQKFLDGPQKYLSQRNFGEQVPKKPSDKTELRCSPIENSENIKCIKDGEEVEYTPMAKSNKQRSYDFRFLGSFPSPFYNNNSQLGQRYSTPGSAQVEGEEDDYDTPSGTGASTPNSSSTQVGQQ